MYSLNGTSSEILTQKPCLNFGRFCDPNFARLTLSMSKIKDSTSLNTNNHYKNKLCAIKYWKLRRWKYAAVFNRPNRQSLKEQSLYCFLLLHQDIVYLCL